MDTQFPRWLQETQSAWANEALQEDNAQTQRTVALGDLALRQQQAKLNQQVVGSQLAGQGLTTQQRQIELDQLNKGMGEVADFQSNSDPSDINAVRNWVPNSPYAQQYREHKLQTYATTQAGMAASSNATQFRAGLADLAKIDPAAFARVNSFAQKPGVGLNPDGSYTGDAWDTLNNESTAAIEAKQQRDVEKAAVAPTIRANAAMYNSDQAAEWHQGVADTNAQSRLDVASVKNDGDLQKLQYRLSNAGDSALDKAQAELLKERLISIRTDATITDPKIKAGQMAEVFNTFQVMHQRSHPELQGVPVPTVAQPAPTVKAGQRVRGPDGKVYPVKSDGTLPTGFSVIQ